MSNYFQFLFLVLVLDIFDADIGSFNELFKGKFLVTSWGISGLSFFFFGTRHMRSIPGVLVTETPAILGDWK